MWSFITKACTIILFTWLNILLTYVNKSNEKNKYYILQIFTSWRLKALWWYIYDWFQEAMN